MVVMIIVAIVMMVVVTVAAVDVFFGAGTQANQHVQRQATAAGFDDFHRWRQLFGDFQAHAGQVGRVDQVGFVENHQVGAGQLVGKQLVQWRFVVQVRVEFALGIDLVREGGKGTGGHGRAVDHGDHRVNGAGTADFRPLESLDQRFWQGQARRFDEDVVEIAATSHQFAHHREKFFLDGAAQAAVGQFIHTAAGFFFGATDGALLEDFAVDAQLAKFVDDYRDAATLGVVEHVPQQRGFTRAEEAGDDGDGKFGQCFHRMPYG
ncbi:hypothetical protein D3C73_1013030 [compost metagenome]